MNTKPIILKAEFDRLKKELFGNSSFVEPDNADPRWHRYDELLQYFYPQFRSQSYKEPELELREFSVSWTIEIDGHSAREAAQNALEIMSDPVTAQVFVVTDTKTKEVTQIDLCDEQE